MTFATEAPSGKTIVLYDNRSGIPRVNVVPPFATLVVESFLQQKGIRELSLSLQDLQSNLSKRIAIDWLFQVNVQEALQESFEGYNIILTTRQNEVGERGFFAFLEKRESGTHHEGREFKL